MGSGAVLCANERGLDLGLPAAAVFGCLSHFWLVLSKAGKNGTYRVSQIVKITTDGD